MAYEVNSGLMSVPNLMEGPSFAMGPLNQMFPVWTEPHSTDPYRAPYREPSPQQLYQTPIQPQQIVPASPPVTPPRVSVPPPPTTSLPPPTTRSDDGPQIRLNPLVMKCNLSHSIPVTTPFRNSPYNQAHFQNEDFEPIHWEPGK